MDLRCPRCGGQIEICVSTLFGELTAAPWIDCENVAGCGYQADENGVEIEIEELKTNVRAE